MYCERVEESMSSGSPLFSFLQLSFHKHVYRSALCGKITIELPILQGFDHNLLSPVVLKG